MDLSNFFWIFVTVVVAFSVLRWFRNRWRTLRQPAVPAVEWTPMEVPNEWGEVVDPDGNCQPAWNGAALAFGIPGGVHELQGNGKQNAPRALRKIAGDFAMDVLLDGHWDPQSGGSFPFVPYQGAGPLLWVSSDEFFRFERAKIKPPFGQAASYFHFESHGGRGPRPLGATGFPETMQPRLRLERHGQTIFAMLGETGRWSIVGYVVLPNAPPELGVGVAAVSNTNEPFSVAFQEVRFFKPTGSSAFGA